MSISNLAFDLRGVTVSKVQGPRAKLGLIPPGCILAPEGKLEELTLVFPEHPVDGQLMFVTFSADVKKVTLTNAVINEALFAKGAKAGQSFTLFFHQETHKWFKLYGS